MKLPPTTLHLIKHFKNNMYFNLILPITFIELLATNPKLTSNSESSIEQEFKHYAADLVLERHNSQIIFIDSNLKTCSKISDQFFEKLTDRVKIVDNGEVVKRKLLKSSAPDYIFVFVPSDRYFFTSLVNLWRHEFWHNRARVQFIFCEPLNDRGFTNLILEAIWRRKIFNFVIVFFTQKLNVLSYNLFSSPKVLELTDVRKNQENLFPNKLRDVKGFKFRVGITTDASIGILDETIFEEDLENLQEFISYINGTVDYEKLPHGFSEILPPDFDFVLASRFPIVDMLKDVEFVRQFYKDRLAGLVPKASLIPPSTYFFMIMDRGTLLGIMVLLLIVAAIAAISDRSEFTKIFFESVCCLFTGSLPHFLNRSFTTKPVFIFFLTFSMFFAVIFQIILVSMLLSKQIDQNIDTVERLYASNLTIYVDKNQQHLLPESIFNKTVPVSTEVLLLMIFEGVANGYVITQSSILKTLKLKGSKNILEKISRIFHIMSEDIIPRYRTYVFPKNSPYVDHIQHFFLTYRSTKSEILLNDWIDSSGRSHQFKKIQRQQLKSVFAILLIGHLFSFSIFVIEICFHKIKKLCK